MNRRRTLIVALGAGAIAAPFGAVAQPSSKVWRVGFLAASTRPASLDTHVFGAFVRGMRELDYLEGRNLKIEWRFADDRPERLPALAAELVAMKVDAIVVSSGAPAVAAQKATTTIPIVFAAVNDPVALGLVASLARPGGNITGRANITNDLSPKRIELLHALLPGLTRAAVLMSNTGVQNTSTAESLRAAGQNRGIAVVTALASSPSEIEPAFAAMQKDQAGAVIVLFNPLFNQQRALIATLAAKYRLPAIGGDRGFTEAGGLMSYGANLADDLFGLATYLDKIFKGARPGDLPVEQPRRFELVINGRTAKTLGLKIPQALALQADRVIE